VANGIDIAALLQRRAPQQRAGASAADPYVYRRRAARYCGTEGAQIDGQACVAETGSGRVVRVCADGSRALDPRWRRPVDTTTGLFTGPWEQMDNGGCPEDPAIEVVLSATDFARLPITASPVHLQPADGLGLVNMPLIVFSDPAPQTLTTTVLGIPVTVIATPTSYLWDFGDGTTLATTDPGHPYPDHTTTGTYTAPGHYAVTLTTTWTGTYQVDATGPWHPVAGTATTTSTPVATQAVEAHTHLIAPTG
jgi:hypothetical protein